MISFVSLCSFTEFKTLETIFFIIIHDIKTTFLHFQISFTGEGNKLISFPLKILDCLENVRFASEIIKLSGKPTVNWTYGCPLTVML